MPLDLSTDYLIFDGIETVTFVSYTSSGSSSQSVAGGLRMALSKRDIDFAGGLMDLTQAIVFHLPVANLGGLTPKPGDKITPASGAAYTVQSASLETLQNRYRCICAQQKAN